MTVIVLLGILNVAMATLNLRNALANKRLMDQMEQWYRRAKANVEDVA